MNSKGIINCITLPTRPNTDDSKHPILIDHLWTNIDYKTESHIIPTDITDHYPFIALFHLSSTKTESVTIKYRHSDENCKRIFAEKINTSNFDFIYDDRINLNDRFHRFNTTIFGCYDNSFPIKIKKIGSKRISNPWITAGLHNSIDQKHKLYRNYKRGIIPFQYYSNYNKHLKLLFKKAKKEYYTNKFIEIHNDSKATWSVINKLVNKKISNTQDILELQINSTTKKDAKEIANELNNFFINVGKQEIIES